MLHTRERSQQCLQVPEFQDLPASSIESLAHVLTEKVYPARGVVYYQGNEVEDIFFVQQGHVKVAGLMHQPLVFYVHIITCCVPSMLAMLCCALPLSGVCTSNNSSAEKYRIVSSKAAAEVALSAFLCYCWLS